MLQAGLRLGKLNQNQFGYEDERVLDVVIQGHAEMWKAMRERDAIYANPDATDEDYMRAAELEGKFAEYGGYDAEARAGSILTDAGIPENLHNGPMREVAPGLKLRVLLAQALFSRPDVLLLDEPTNNLDINSIRWLEGILNDYNATMVIISHDRHFLNQVCTHMADLDYGRIQVYPGNYDDYMEASIQARNRIATANAKAKEKVAELQEFVRRFSANKSKARQATSRQKLIEKIKVEDMKPSSRQYPWIRFEYDDKDKLHRLAAEIEHLTFGYDPAESVIKKFSTTIDAGDKIAIIGENGVGKTTLLRLLLGAEAGGLAPQKGAVKWSEKAKPGYFAQDHSADFDEDTNLTEWVWQWVREGGFEGADVETLVRGTLGRLLFQGDDVKKSVRVISGGEQGRMLFGKLMLLRRNVLLLDEPTNHLDMESIESLNTAVEKFPGTVIFVSHDREFVSSLATRIFDIKTDRSIVDYRGTYEEYLASQGLE
jgi:ATPase subunit of ABC transporter with duplicated ATPase domains